MKTSELQGAALDWAVAKCEGMYVRPTRGGWFVFDSDAYAEFRNDYNDDKLQAFRPSTNWAQGGAIIEREGITVAPDDVAPWCAFIDRGTADDVIYSGTTPLIAAMRCYVASKLGDNVELPEGLK